MNGLHKYLFINITVIALVFGCADLLAAQSFTGSVDSVDTNQDKIQREGQEFINPVVTQVIPIPVEALGDPSTYTLGKTDVINITVMRHPEVSGEYVVNNEGKIQYEFVGDVKVEGLTKDEVKNIVTKNLSDFIIAPEVTIKIAGYNSKVVYVIGEVGLPGKIFMRGDTITVREALMQAGLPLITAAAKKSKLITPAENGKPDQKGVNVFALLYEGDLRENLVMKPGDTLYIPPTMMAKTMRVLNPIAQPIGTAAGTGRTVMTGF